MAAYYSRTSSTSVWYGWNVTYAATSASTTSWGVNGGTTTSTPLIWTGWNQTYTTSSTATNLVDVDIWGVWNRGRPVRAQVVPATPRIEVQETAEQRRERQERYERERRAQEEVRTAADVKARKILVETLDAAQRAIFEQHGYFDVKLDDGRTFRITKGQSHNVFRLDEQGRVRESYCAYPRDNLPVYDTMLAQKLILEASPQTFFGVANKGGDRLPQGN